MSAQNISPNDCCRKWSRFVLLKDQKRNIFFCLYQFTCCKSLTAFGVCSVKLFVLNTLFFPGVLQGSEMVRDGENENQKVIPERIIKGKKHQF